MICFVTILFVDHTNHDNFLLKLVRVDFLAYIPAPSNATRNLRCGGREASEALRATAGDVL
jgi:hypothetical protein